ncbi:hypothetical protein [Novosphingobium sp. ST904]|uniref:hypothetical protein n=1 Tax=Novosphingobium sp. ST904 TaxID=1684385 RepID=UPI000A49FAC4|nr:hypothetical protein [Novosphingobium sp. ST904]
MAAVVDIRRSIFAQIVAWAILIAALITFGLWLLTNATIQRTNALALERAVDVDLAGMVDIYAAAARSSYPTASTIASRFSRAMPIRPTICLPMPRAAHWRGI